MAKQRGIHQVAGKINNLCYYEQKYVRGGLIRRINEAMSGRLKTDPAFEQTRHANSVFGMCSIFSAQILGVLFSRGQFMKKPSVHAELTRDILKVFKSQENHEYGDIIQYNPNSNSLFSAYINSLFKRPLNKFIPSIPMFGGYKDPGTYEVLTINEQHLENIVSYFKCRGLVISVVNGSYIYSPSFNPSIGKYQANEVHYGTGGFGNTWVSGDGDFDLEILWNAGDDGLYFDQITIFPYFNDTTNQRPEIKTNLAISGIITNVS